jgi:hypothetical protein
MQLSEENVIAMDAHSPIDANGNVLRECIADTLSMPTIQCVNVAYVGARTAKRIQRIALAQ